MNKVYLAADFGGGSGRVIAGWLNDGRLVMEEIHRFSNDTVIANGTMYWDVLRLFFEIKTSITKAVNQGGFDAIGIDTWGVDYALLDKNGDLIGEVFSYRDDRNAVALQEVEKIISFEESYKITGIQRAQYNTVYQLYADKTSGKLDKAETMLSIPDYLHYLLSGVKKNEYTHASTSGLLDAKTGDWSWEIIDKLGYPRKIFGKVYKPGEVLGNLKEEIAREALRLAMHKLPIKCKFVKKEESGESND